MNSSEGRGSGPFRSLGRIRRKGLTRGAIIGWFAALLGAVSGAAALGDNSFFTHLATGRRILDGHLPSTDPHSFSAHGHAWVIQSWFASLLYGLADEVGHGLGIRLGVAALSALLAVLLWRLTRPAGSIVARLAAVAPALVIGQVSWGARPLIFGLLGFALVLVWLREERDPRWLVPVMWVWVNTHGSFPMGLVLIVVARPLALLTILPFRYPWRDWTFLSWVGLKGAVPITLATFPLMYGVPRAMLLFDAVFFVVVLSAIVQGSTLPSVARWLGLDWSWISIIGLLGNAVWSTRFLLQWIASERKGESVVPVSFWYYSLAGTFFLALYFILKRDPVGILSYLPNSVVYIRNLQLIRLKEARDRLQSLKEDPLGS